MESRALLDQQLCRLVDRLCAMEYRFTLEVEFRLTNIRDDPGEYDITQFLPEFSEKGIVIVVDGDDCDRVRYSTCTR